MGDNQDVDEDDDYNRNKTYQVANQGQVTKPVVSDDSDLDIFGMGDDIPV